MNGAFQIHAPKFILIAMLTILQLQMCPSIFLCPDRLYSQILIGTIKDFKPYVFIKLPCRNSRRKILLNCIYYTFYLKFPKK